MEEKKNNEISLEMAVKNLDEIFNINEISDTKIEGKSYRTNDYEYHIQESDFKQVYVYTKLFEMFTDGGVIVNSGKDMICEITGKTDNCTIFKLV